MAKLTNGAAGQTLVWKFHHIQFMRMTEEQQKKIQMSMLLAKS
jgi:hypothetical protein